MISENSNIILRLRSPDGTKRLEVNKNENVNTFLSQLRKEFNIKDDDNFHVFTDQSRMTEINSKKSSLNNYNVKHGDMLYLNFDHKNIALSNASESVNFNAKEEIDKEVEKKDSKIVEDLIEDDVDKIISQQDGKIVRGQDAKYCHHPKHSKCIHCTPIEPYDEDYLKNHEPPIKHMSFHAYLRKLMSGTDKGKLATLDVGCCRITPGCKEHKPWPKGICTKCQPNAVTLQRQPYRHVDIIMFENASIVENFLNFWRKTGYQRVAYLYGHYEPHKDVPLGIKAVVSALYEPPQINTATSVKFLEDPMDATVDWLASQLGMKRVGWIFTDLAVEKKVVNKEKTPTTGLVKCLRNKDTYFLSAAECILAAHLQNKFPNVCKAAPHHIFGSKFVTVVVTGDQNNAIHFEGYQVTQQCMSLVRDQCLVPTIDVPELGYVPESTNHKYVPDVFYKAKDGYGNEVLHIARPLPVEYLMVDVPASCPVDPIYTFTHDASKDVFPIENRLNYLDENQTFYTFAHYIKQYGDDKLFEALNDFHVLLYLTNMEVLPMMSSMEPLLKAIKEKDKEMFQRWCLSDNWQTVQKLIEMEVPPPSSQSSSTAARSPFPFDNSRPPRRNLFGAAHPFREEFHFTSHGTADRADQMITADQSGGASIGDVEVVNVPDDVHWTCEHCTFVNERCTQECEVCGLPPPTLGQINNQ